MISLRSTLLLVAILWSCSWLLVAATPTHRRATKGLPDSTVNLIKALLNQTATLSWEIGTHAQALTEYDYASLSPFAPNSIPPPTSPVATTVLAIASDIVANKPSNTLALMDDGSAGDPASVGVSVVLANYTATGQEGNGLARSAYAVAADDQVQFLLGKVPRTPDGAISHRTSEVALWSDFVYMVPPFFAYYGVLTSNISIITESYEQIRLYRQYLRQPSGLWAHIVMGSNADPGQWATGNAWAASGILRTMATIVRSNYATSFTSQTTDLANWALEITQAAFSMQPANGLFPNYFNETASSTTFSDAASTALLAACSYRLAQLSISSSTIPQAEVARSAVYNSINPQTGVLSPVVDPLAYDVEGNESPEGQAFVLIMEASWRDWMSEGGVAPSGSTSAASSIFLKNLNFLGDFLSTWHLVWIALSAVTASVAVIF